MSTRGCLIIVAAMPSFLLAALAATLAWNASEWPLPPIAKKLNGAMSARDAEFKRRVSWRYQPGRPEHRLVSDMRAQAFTLSTERGGWAEAELQRFVLCGNEEWAVYWQASGGKITQVAGLYRVICL